MKKMVCAVLLAVFVCGSLKVAGAELLWERTGEKLVPEILKQQAVFDEMQWDLARWYNLNLTSDWQEPGFEDAYEEILALHEDAMGYITVPSEGLALPICHGAGKDGSAGHIRTTALPIGGLGTHCALTGTFSLDTGDCFYIHILGQVRPYQVCETRIVPGEGLAFPVEENRELCTLVHSGPGGTVHLMQGSYCEGAPEEGTILVEEQGDADGWLIAACIALALGILLVPFLMWIKGR